MMISTNNCYHISKKEIDHILEKYNQNELYKLLENNSEIEYFLENYIYKTYKVCCNYMEINISDTMSIEVIEYIKNKIKSLL